MPHNARDLIASRFGDAIATIENSSDVSVAAASIQLVTYNSKRIKLQMANGGFSTVIIDFNPNVATPKGFPLAPGQVAEFDWQEDYEAVTFQWFGIVPSGGGPANVHIVETILTGTDTKG